MLHFCSLSLHLTSFVFPDFFLLGVSFQQYLEHIPVPVVDKKVCNSQKHYNGHLAVFDICTGARTDKPTCKVTFFMLRSLAASWYFDICFSCLVVVIYSNLNLCKFFTYVTKTRANLSTYSRKPGNYNGTINFEIDIMKMASPIN